MKFAATSAVAVACVLAMWSAPACAADAIEGTWKLALLSDDGAKQLDDTIVIRNETLTSTRLAKEGFGAIPCDGGSRPGGVGNFTAAGKSAKGGKCKWTGTVLSNTITGSLELTTPDGTTTSFTLKGERAGK